MSMLPTLWYCLICAELGLYMLLDGANLGVGLLSLLPQEKDKAAGNRDRMLQILGPIWNANETWLLVAVGSLFGAFPLAYSIALNALYVPGMIILLGLMGRAVSFEFYAYADKKSFWAGLFGVSSAVVVVGQGCALGGLLSGITVIHGRFAGGAWDWATPLTLLVVLGILCGYVVLGYTYLLREEAHAYQQKGSSRIYYLCLALFALGAVGLLMSTYPYLIPPSVTFMQAASPDSTLRFMLWGVGPLLPIILAYNWYLHKIFRRDFSATKPK